MVQPHFPAHFLAAVLTPARTPPPNTPHSDRLWAPELHVLDGRWYIYYAAQDPRLGNKSHRIYVLGGPPATASPNEPSSWTFLGPIRNLDQRQWAIDATVFEQMAAYSWSTQAGPSHQTATGPT